jgi:hypothetical protein
MNKKFTIKEKSTKATAADGKTYTIKIAKDETEEKAA